MEETKFGIVAPLPGVAVNDLIGFTKKCEEGGFDSVWFPDHILFMAKKLTPEVWSIITGASVITNKIQLGAVGDPHRMHPATFAHRLATVDHISEGRIFSCLGYGEKMNLDYYGIKWDKALVRLRESISVMRELWKGQEVNFNGNYFNMNNAELRISPINNTVPIYIAATGPRSLRVAGEIGDGWVTNAMPTWVYSKKNESVIEGQKGNEFVKGRFEKAIYIFISVAEDKDEAYKTLDNIKHAIIWPDVINEAGYDLDISEEYSGLSYTKIMPNDTEMLKKFREMGQKYYTREILSDFIIYGTAEDVKTRLDEYINCGVNHFILRDFSPDLEYSFNILTRQVLPSLR
ncbi:MAG: LLM class flavin-dependent oxidoreductase [Thermodesulfobacteriota bacterium]